MKRVKKSLPVFAIVILAVLIFYAVSLVVPFIWAIDTSLKSMMDFTIDPVWPSFSFTFENYLQAFDKFFVEVGSGETLRPIYYEGMMLNLSTRWAARLSKRQSFALRLTLRRDLILSLTRLFIRLLS